MERKDEIFGIKRFIRPMLFTPILMRFFFKYTHTAQTPNDIALFLRFGSIVDSLDEKRRKKTNKKKK